MTILGDTRKVNNPQKDHILWEVTLEAQRLIFRAGGSNVAVGLTGSRPEEQLKRTMRFDARFFYELDPGAYRSSSQVLKILSAGRNGFSKRELQNTTLSKSNIFEDHNASKFDHGLYDWDLTGTIHEAEKYGIESAIYDAFYAGGIRYLVLTTSSRRGSKADTRRIWRTLLMDTLADYPGHTLKIKKQRTYGRSSAGCGNMIVSQAIIRGPVK